MRPRSRIPKTWRLRRGGRGNAKYTAVGYGPDGREVMVVSFGDRRYSDYTRHKDSARMQRYLARHRAREHWEDLSTAGAWSRWLLWSRLEMNDAIGAMEQRFGITIAT